MKAYKKMEKSRDQCYYLRSTKFGDDVDRVIAKRRQINGLILLTDIAYHSL